MSKRRYRVAQWATGNIGLRSLRAVIEHPDLDLVGVYVYSEAKEGRDAGELCGLPPTGVTATRSIEDIVAAGPDCVLYMPDRTELDVVCRLLESGANVVTTRDEFHRPASLDPETRERVEEACRRGNSSLHATGSSPGFITEALPLTLLSIARRLDCLTIEEFADMSSRNSPEMIFDMLGFGRDPVGFDIDQLAQFAAHTFTGSLGTLADAIAMPLDDVGANGEVAVSRQAVNIAAGRIEAGTVGAIRVEATGIRKGEPLLRFRAHWYLTADVEPAWDLRATGWHVVVDGDTPLDVAIHFPVPDEDWAATSPGLTAHRPVNCIPYVCAAEPGIRTIADLPNVAATLTR
jgi:4-hydroxy-tetrahydrodipicolinate reductase